jgi:YD repeat-containing protein
MKTIFTTRSKKNFITRVISWAMASIIAVVTSPAPMAFAQSAAPASEPIPTPPASIMPKADTKPVHVKTGPHKLNKIINKLSFSAQPTDLEISCARVFSEPLVPMTGQPAAGENEAVAAALKSFKKKNSFENLSDLSQFVSAFPNSRWNPAIQLNMGLLRFNTGHLTEALALLEVAWNGSKSESGQAQMAVANRAIAKLLVINARLGRAETLDKMLADLGHRPFFGSDEEMVKSARQGLWLMRNKPECAFKCGPFAVDSIVFLHKPVQSRSRLIDKVQSTKNGTNLAQVKGWADECGLKYQMARRSAGAPIVVPAIMHWSLGHFAAITSQTKDYYIVKDPTFDSNATIALKPETIDAESDGYFLVPNGPLPAGWQTVSSEEARTVWGKGNSPRANTDDMGKGQPRNCPCEICCPPGMAHASAWQMNAMLNIKDTPLTYQPPLGPSIPFALNYSQGESQQPSTFTFTNFGPDWKFTWLSYLTVAGGTNVATIRVRGGGSEVCTPVGGIYPPDVLTQATLVSMGGGVYQRQLPDGTIQIFNQPDGSGDIFMTEETDPQGNSVLIQYDANFRITSITDAINQVSTVSYVSNTIGNSGFYKVASFTDPFGRTCSFSYDSTNTNLLSITDAVGLTSKFVYDTSSTFITSMTTPYGTTSFYTYVPGNNGFPATGLRFTFPDGSSAVIENWLNEPKATYYWDREATMLYPEDPATQNYTHCEYTKWCYDGNTASERAVPQFKVEPLESLSQINYS